MSVYLSVCLSTHISWQPQVQVSQNIMYVTCGHGSVLWWHYNTLCTSFCGRRDANRPKSKTVLCFIEFTSGTIPMSDNVTLSLINFVRKWHCGQSFYLWWLACWKMTMIMVLFMYCHSVNDFTFYNYKGRERTYDWQWICSDELPQVSTGTATPTNTHMLKDIM